MTELKITVKFPKDRHINTFVNMLAWMELCGNAGHCTDFQVRLDGDGDARPKFVFENKELQTSYDELRKRYEKKEFRTIPNYPGDIDVKFSIS